MIITKDVSEYRQSLPVIAMPEYLQILPAISDYGYFVSDDKVLPFILRKRLIFRWIEFTTGVLNCPAKEAEQIFLEEVLECSQKLNPDWMLCRNTALFTSVPVESIYCKFGTFKINLQKTEEELFFSLHSGYRNEIRKAEKQGIVISNSTKNMHNAVSVIHETMKRQNKMSHPYSYFARYKSLGDNVECWIASDNGKCVGSAILVWNKECAYYLYGGTGDEAPPYANKYLHWKAILSMKKRGVKFYDFVGARINPAKGSKYEGIQNFKSRFGGVLEQGYIFKSITNRFKYRLYTKLFAIYFWIKGDKYNGDVIDQEKLRGNI
jgi:hypothetical protein